MMTTAHSANPSLKPVRLTLDGVDVQRGEFVLCKNISRTLHAGDVCHLIGENGLGKTTLLSQIAGLLPLMQGAVRFSDMDDDADDAQMVYISHQIGISSQLTVAQNLRFLLSLYGVAVDDAVLEDALTAVGLQGLGDISSVQLSAGQMRRIGLARLFVLDVSHAPLWLLDEPLTALDASMVLRLEARITAFAAAGGAVLMTSHQATQAANCVLDLAEFAL